MSWKSLGFFFLGRWAPCQEFRVFGYEYRWKSANMESIEILTDQITASLPYSSLVDLWCSRMLPGRFPSLKRDNSSSETLSLSKTHH